MKLVAIIVAAWCAASVAVAALWSRWRRCAPSAAAFAPPQAARPAAHTTFVPPTVLADLVSPAARLFHIECGDVAFNFNHIELLETAVRILEERYPDEVPTVYMT